MSEKSTPRTRQVTSDCEATECGECVSIEPCAGDDVRYCGFYEDWQDMSKNGNPIRLSECLTDEVKANNAMQAIQYMECLKAEGMIDRVEVEKALRCIEDMRQSAYSEASKLPMYSAMRDLEEITFKRCELRLKELLKKEPK